jgi:hypothetical protein
VVWVLSYFALGCIFYAVRWSVVGNTVLLRAQQQAVDAGYNQAVGTGLCLFAVVFILLPTWPIALAARAIKAGT